MFNAKYYSQLAKITQQLNKENQRYFGTIQQYLLLAVMTKKESALQEQVINMAQDALEAQNNGESAESYFGKNPRELVDEILAQTPKAQFKDLWHLMAGTISFVMFFLLFSRAFYPETFQLPLGNLILVSLISVAFFYTSFRLLQVASFKFNPFKIFLAFILPIVGFVGLMLVVFLVLPPLLAIPIAYPFDLVVLGVIMVIALVSVFVSKERTSFGLLGMLLVCGLLAIYSRYQTAHHLVMSEQFTMMAAFLMLGAFCLDMIWLVWSTVKEVKKAKQVK